VAGERDGMGASLIDGRAEQAVPVVDAVDALLNLIAEDAAPLSCSSQVAHAKVIVRPGSGAADQLAGHAAALERGGATVRC
jgi:carboxylate-amine ligase